MIIYKSGKNFRTFGNSLYKARITAIFADNSPEKKAYDCFTQQCNHIFGEKAQKNIDEYFEHSVKCMDFWRSIGKDDCAEILKDLEDTFIKGAAFDYIANNKKI